MRVGRLEGWSGPPQKEWGGGGEKEGGGKVAWWGKLFGNVATDETLSRKLGRARY